MCGSGAQVSHLTHVQPPDGGRLTRDLTLDASQPLARSAVALVRLRLWGIRFTPPCGLDTDSKAQAEQVRAVAVERLGASIGVLPPAVMADLDEALRLHLAL